MNRRPIDSVKDFIWYGFGESSESGYLDLMIKLNSFYIKPTRFANIKAIYFNNTIDFKLSEMNALFLYHYKL
jgi:hypothetical protein